MKFKRLFQKKILSEKILCYYFKLKYFKKNLFNIKKIIFFLNIDVNIYSKRFQIILKKS